MHFSLCVCIELNKAYCSAPSLIQWSLLQRAQSELAAHQKKILHVDNHMGISIAGLTADARLLWWVPPQPLR